MKTSTALRLISKDVYEMWLTSKIYNGDVPAKSIVAKHYGIKTKDVNDCIKYQERGKIKLTKAAKSFTGKVTSKDCDLLWAKAVKAKAGHKCEHTGCNRRDLQSHHVISRTNWALRFDLENGVCLCTYHHLFWAHKDAIGFAAFIKTKRDIPYLESKRGNRSKLDYSAIALYLQSKIKEFTQNKAA